MYSLVLRERLSVRQGEMVSPTNPFWSKKSPIQNLEESEKVVMVGFLTMTRLIEIPWCDDWRKSCQRAKSSRVGRFSLKFFIFLAVWSPKILPGLVMNQMASK